MKKWLRILLFPAVLILLSTGLGVGSASAAETVSILKVRQVNGNGKVFIPQVQGMTDAKTQAMLNAKIKDAILTLNNPTPASSLNGDFTVSFYNSNLLGIHFTGYSFTKGAVHPNKIDLGIHIDLATGKIYKLADLFTDGAGFMGRIKAQCAMNRERYRLQSEGLWDGWTHEDFLHSWQGDDAAFLLSDKAVRVYAIPSYATGAISGYGVPYADLIEIIDQKGSLWRALQAQPMLPIVVSADNVIDKTMVKVGDVYAGLTVEAVDRRNGSLTDARFTGEKELVGVSEWVENMGDGAGYIFLVDDFYADSLPKLKGFETKNSLTLTLDVNSPSLPKEKSHVKIIVDNYSIGERQIMTKARLVAIVSMEP